MGWAKQDWPPQMSFVKKRDMGHLNFMSTIQIEKSDRTKLLHHTQSGGMYRLTRRRVNVFVSRRYTKLLER